MGFIYFNFTFNDSYPGFIPQWFPSNFMKYDPSLNEKITYRIECNTTYI